MPINFRIWSDLRLEKIVEKLDSYGKEFLTRQIFEGEYAGFDEPSDSNGFTLNCIYKYRNNKIKQWVFLLVVVLLLLGIMISYAGQVDRITK